MSAARGVPSVTYVRILSSGAGAGQSSDILTDGSNALTVLEPGCPSTRHEVAQVLDKGISDQDVCELTIGSQAGVGMGAALNPVSAFVHDAATALITVIGSRNTKKSLFLKKTFLPFLANELFSVISEKEQQSNLEYFQAQLSISAFEIQDEVITDLLRPSSRGLAVSISAEDGVIVSGLHKETITDEFSLRRAISEACDNRASHTLPPGASMETSTAVWEIELRQSESVSYGGEGMGGSNIRKCYSRLVIVDVPSVDALTQGGSNLRQLESPTLYKSLLSFVDVSKRLSNPSRAALAPFRTSKLTHYLSEMLGGNAIVVGLGILASGEPVVTRKTLEIVGALTSAVHFPVGGRELTEVLSGLLCKYRSLMLQLMDEIANGAPIGEQPQEFSMEKVTQLQRQMAEAMLERNTAKEDRARIFEMMELLKAKYNTIVEEKMAQSQELIQVEQDKLSIARALVELKLEFSQVQEKAEKDRFDLTSSLLGSKNENFELDSQILLARTESTTLKNENSELERMLKVVKEELTSTNAALHEVRDHLQREEDKNVELGTELLTLVNQRETLQVRCNDLIQKLDAASVKLAIVDTHEAEVGNSIELLRTQVRTAEDELAASKRQLGESELELRKISIDMERIQKDAERNAQDLAKEKEQFLRAAEEEKNAIIKSAEDDRKNLQQQFQQQIKDLSRGKSVEMIPLPEAQARESKLERRVRDLERDLQRSKDDLSASQKEKSSVEKELAVIRQTFRTKLSSLISDSDRAGTPLTSAATNENGRPTSSSSSNKPKSLDTESALKDLVGSYTDSEKNLKLELEDANNSATRLRVAFRTLYDKYRAALDTIEDQLPKVAGLAVKEALTEQKIIGDAALAGAAAEIDSSQQAEREAMRHRVRIAEDGLLAEQQRAMNIVDTYKRTLEKTEGKLAASRKEVADLHAQIRQLIEAGDGGGGEARQQQERMMRILQEQLAEQMRNMEGSPNKQGQGSKEKIQRPTSPSTNEDSSLALKQAREYIAQLEENAPAAVLNKFRETERKAIQLSARNTALEEELTNYQAYMRDTVIQYKRHTSALQQQLIGGNSKPQHQPPLSIESNSHTNFPAINGNKK